jgi:hypothetical protein
MIGASRVGDPPLPQGTRGACSNSAPCVQKGALGATGIPAQCTIILSVLYSEGGKRGDKQPDCPKPRSPETLTRVC